MQVCLPPSSCYRPLGRWLDVHLRPNASGLKKSRFWFGPIPLAILRRRARRFASVPNVLTPPELLVRVPKDGPGDVERSDRFLCASIMDLDTSCAPAEGGGAPLGVISQNISTPRARPAFFSKKEKAASANLSSGSVRAQQSHKRNRSTSSSSRTPSSRGAAGPSRPPPSSAHVPSSSDGGSGGYPPPLLFLRLTRARHG